ncbi:MAG: hypothetical protein HFJ41_05775 [Clostridia bacterium]|nr:hypothetical protein [Clostridia bacterium]
MLKCIQYFAYLLGVEPSWVSLIIALLLILGIVKCIYPWRPTWKAEETTKEDGSKVTKYYRLDD